MYLIAFIININNYLDNQADHPSWPAADRREVPPKCDDPWTAGPHEPGLLEKHRPSVQRPFAGASFRFDPGN